MKKNTYTINHNDKTITLTKAYAKVANTPSTKEFRELASLHKHFPDYDIVMRTANVSDDKEKHHGLSVTRMEHIIKDLLKDEATLSEFEAVKAYYTGASGYYGKIKKWFLTKYPNYQEIDLSQMATNQKSDNLTSVAPAENAPAA